MKSCFCRRFVRAAARHQGGGVKLTPDLTLPHPSYTEAQLTFTSLWPPIQSHAAFQFGTAEVAMPDATRKVMVPPDRPSAWLKRVHGSGQRFYSRFRTRYRFRQRPAT